jgi:hypothetical protein
MDLREEGCRPDLASSDQGPLASSCEHCNENSDSIKDGKFRNQLNDFSAPWSSLVIRHFRQEFNMKLCSVFVRYGPQVYKLGLSLTKMSLYIYCSKSVHRVLTETHKDGGTDECL